MNLGPPNTVVNHVIPPPDPNNPRPAPDMQGPVQANVAWYGAPIRVSSQPQQRINMPQGGRDDLADPNNPPQPIDKRTYFMTNMIKPYDERITNGNSSEFHNDYTTLLQQGTLNNSAPGVYPIDDEFTHTDVTPVAFQTKQDWHIHRKAVEKVIMRQADCNYWLFYIYQKLDHFRFDGSQQADVNHEYIEDLRIGTYGSEFFRKLDFALVYDKFYRFINKVFVPTIKMWKGDQYLNEKDNVACYAIHNMLYMVVRHLVAIREYYEKLCPNRERNQKVQRRDPTQLRLDLEKILNHEFNDPNSEEFGRALGTKWNERTANNQSNLGIQAQQNDQQHYFGQNWFTPQWFNNLIQAQQNRGNQNQRNAGWRPTTQKEKLHYLNYKILSYARKFLLCKLIFVQDQNELTTLAIHAIVKTEVGMLVWITKMILNLDFSQQHNQFAQNFVIPDFSKDFRFDDRVYRRYPHRLYGSLRVTANAVNANPKSYPKNPLYIGNPLSWPIFSRPYEGPWYWYPTTPRFVDEQLGGNDHVHMPGRITNPNRRRQGENFRVHPRNNVINQNRVTPYMQSPFINNPNHINQRDIRAPYWENQVYFNAENNIQGPPRVDSNQRNPRNDAGVPGHSRVYGDPVNQNLKRNVFIRGNHGNLEPTVDDKEQGRVIAQIRYYRNNHIHWQNIPAQGNLTWGAGQWYCPRLGPPDEGRYYRYVPDFLKIEDWTYPRYPQQNPEPMFFYMRLPYIPCDHPIFDLLDIDPDNNDDWHRVDIVPTNANIWPNIWKNNLHVDHFYLPPPYWLPEGYTEHMLQQQYNDLFYYKYNRMNAQEKIEWDRYVGRPIQTDLQRGFPRIARGYYAGARQRGNEAMYRQPIQINQQMLQSIFGDYQINPEENRITLDDKEIMSEDISNVQQVDQDVNNDTTKNWAPQEAQYTKDLDPNEMMKNTLYNKDKEENTTVNNPQLIDRIRYTDDGELIDENENDQMEDDEDEDNPNIQEQDVFEDDVKRKRGREDISYDPDEEEPVSNKRFKIREPDVFEDEVKRKRGHEDIIYDPDEEEEPHINKRFKIRSN